MSTWILHHSGDANPVPRRVPHTYQLAVARRGAIVLVPCAGVEAHALWVALGSPAVLSLGLSLPDTLAESWEARRRACRGDTIIVSTEHGHLRRAALLMRILCLGAGIRVEAPPAPHGNYRDRWWRLGRDAARALWVRITEGTGVRA